MIPLWGWLRESRIDRDGGTAAKEMTRLLSLAPLSLSTSKPKMNVRSVLKFIRGSTLVSMQLINRIPKKILMLFPVPLLLLSSLR